MPADVSSFPFGIRGSIQLKRKGIQCIAFMEDGFNIHLYLDKVHFSEKVADLTVRTEIYSNTTLYKKEYELNLRSKKKGRLKKEQLARLK